MPALRVSLDLLARSFLAGEATPEPIVKRAEDLLARPAPWLVPIAARYCEWCVGRMRPRQREVVEFLRQERTIRRIVRSRPARLAIHHWIPEPPEMQPAPAALAWNVPAIPTAGALADWLWLETGELQWFADLHLLCAGDETTAHHHYHYQLIQKSSLSARLIEAPKRRLKRMQREILREILAHVPVHSAAHGFLPGRSAATFAADHVGKPAVLRLDLRHFFAGIRQSRVQTLFRLMGYPETVADLLGGICCNAVPRRFWAHQALEPDLREQLSVLYAAPHLPQGAPSSPTLANLCAYRLDCRLAGLSRAWGVAYTRYADDLAFSGASEFGRGAQRFAAQVAAIALEEGFAINHRKTRLRLQSGSQRLAGLIVNNRVNVPRADFDRLKAILTNCVRSGPTSQNREAHPAFRDHLLGRISYMASINPEKSQRLRALFDEIQWD